MGLFDLFGKKQAQADTPFDVETYSIFDEFKLCFDHKNIDYSKFNERKYESWGEQNQELTFTNKVVTPLFFDKIVIDIKPNGNKRYRFLKSDSKSINSKEKEYFLSFINKLHKKYGESDSGGVKTNLMSSDELNQVINGGWKGRNWDSQDLKIIVSSSGLILEEK